VQRCEKVKTQSLSIGELAERTGWSVPTTRFHEEIGLIPTAARKAGGSRAYATSDARLLTFIRRCRDFGVPVEPVRNLVTLSTSHDRKCFEARDRCELAIEEGIAMQVKAYPTARWRLPAACSEHNFYTPGKTPN
jgi:DNA-binding transcriptional MerR regulator